MLSHLMQFKMASLCNCKSLKFECTPVHLTKVSPTLPSILKVKQFQHCEDCWVLPLFTPLSVIHGVMWSLALSCLQVVSQLMQKREKSCVQYFLHIFWSLSVYIYAQFQSLFRLHHYMSTLRETEAGRRQKWCRSVEVEVHNDNEDHNGHNDQRV